MTRFSPHFGQTLEEEQLLGDLLAGQLAEPQRSYVLARLAADPESRNILQMALAALDAAQKGDDLRAA